MNKIFREGFFDFGSGGANPESEPLSEKNITRIANEISDEVMKIVQRHLEGYKAPEAPALEKLEPSEPAGEHLNVKSIVCLHVDAVIARVSELNLPGWTAEMNKTIREGVLRAYDKCFARDGRPYFPQKEYFLQPAGEGEAPDDYPISGWLLAKRGWRYDYSGPFTKGNLTISPSGENFKEDKWTVWKNGNLSEGRERDIFTVKELNELEGSGRSAGERKFCNKCSGKVRQGAELHSGVRGWTCEKCGTSGVAGKQEPDADEDEDLLSAYVRVDKEKTQQIAQLKKELAEAKEFEGKLKADIEAMYDEEFRLRTELAALKATPSDSNINKSDTK